MNKKGDPFAGIKIPDIPDDDDEKLSKSGKAGNTKRMSVERIYQKKTQLEHILLRPDTYIGSVESVTQVCAVLCDLLHFNSYYVENFIDLN